jgi:hypothetical protein
MGKTTLASGSAEGDSPLLEREVSSLHPSRRRRRQNREVATALLYSYVP